jgi:murein DD-endopeptidase MepM/ murein hydrolase activator NlpD
VTRSLAAIPAPPPRAGGKFLWPVQGRTIAGYGRKKNGLHNDGINIAAPRGAPVQAAENGVVAYIGNELRGFGNLILIRHAGGWVTAYAHNAGFLVRRGDTVKRGQVIARIGSSGNVATPQLHFEIRKGARSVDPTRFLGPQRAAAAQSG